MKKFLTLLIGLLLAVAAFAQAYPARPIKLIVPFPAGGGADGIARPLADDLRKRLSQTIVVENRSGASSILGTDLVAKSDPDGYTLLINTDNIGLYSHLYSKLPFDLFNDLVPITFVSEAPLVLVSNPGVPAKNLLELIALARKEPNQLAFAHQGAGTPQHLAFELFKRKADVQILTPAYRGTGPVLQDLLAGHVQVGMFGLGGAVLQQIKAGKLRAHAVFTATRSKLAPDIPTMAEAGLSGVQANLRVVLMAPRGTPPEILKTLHATVMESLKNPDVQSQLLKQGHDTIGTSLEETSRTMREEHESWGPIIKAANIKLD